MMRYARHGFTLVEMLLVVALIVLLVSILLPALRSARMRAWMVHCGANQRQVGAAAITFAPDNQGRLPPSVNGRTDGWWTLPNRINYHTEKQNGAGLNGGWMGKFMAPYITHADFLLCPLAPGKPANADAELRSGQAWIVDASYYMFWNFKGYASQTQGFTGPTTARVKFGSALLTCDRFDFQEPADYLGWNSAHPFPGALRGFQFWQLPDPAATLPKNVELNAGYIDNHVGPYRSDDTSSFNPGTHGSHPAKHYIPKDR